jgi:hypothetical protein
VRPDIINAKKSVIWLPFLSDFGLPLVKMLQNFVYKKIAAEIPSSWKHSSLMNPGLPNAIFPKC